MSSRLTSQCVGDAVPARIAGYYDAADAGRVDEAAEQLAEHVMAGLAPPPEDEVAPRRTFKGREAMREFLRGRGTPALRHDLLFCGFDGNRCFIEGRMVDADDRPATTFVSSFRLDADGRIERYVAFACEPFDELPRTGDAAPGDARRRVDDYFHHLDAGEWEQAVDQFSPDVTYNHPPYRNTGITTNKRVIFRGHAELLDGFNHRGKAAFDHRLIAFTQRGPNAMFELLIDGMPDGTTPGSVCSLSLGDDGRIKRYLAFLSVESVPD
jgi:hypothetical protein